MTKLKIDELEERLKINEVPLEDWFEETDLLNHCVRLCGGIIYVDWYSTLEDGCVYVSYFSKKIGGYQIILSSDAYRSIESLRELAELLIEHDEEACKLEKKLPKIAR